MTDFARDLLWDEEKPVPLPTAKADDGRADRRDSMDNVRAGPQRLPSGLAERLQAGAGNAALAVSMTVEAPELGTETAAPVERQPAPAPKAEALPPVATDAAETKEEAPPAADDTGRRAAALGETLTVLARRPEDAPLDFLFETYEGAPMREAEKAADLLLALVLRADAVRRPSISAALRPALKAHAGALLARLLAVRIGGMLAAPAPSPPEPPPAPPPEPGGG